MIDNTCFNEILHVEKNWGLMLIFWHTFAPWWHCWAVLLTHNLQHIFKGYIFIWSLLLCVCKWITVFLMFISCTQWCVHANNEQFNVVYVNIFIDFMLLMCFVWVTLFRFLFQCWCYCALNSSLRNICSSFYTNWLQFQDLLQERYYLWGQ